MSDDFFIKENQADLVAKLRKQSMWGKIHLLSEKDPALAELLDKVVFYYKLKYGDR